MHVILLSHEYPPFIIGGVGTFTKNLAYGLQKKGVKVTVIAGYPVPKTGVEVASSQNEKGIDVLRFPYLDLPPRHTFFQVLNRKKLYKVIQTLDGDIIHGQSGGLFPSLRHLKRLAKTIVTFHTNLKLELMMSLYSLTRGGSLGDIYTYILGYPFWSYALKKEYENSDVSVAVSKNLMTELSSELGKKKQGEILFIHNGVDAGTLEKTYSEICCEEENLCPTIFFGGRFFWRKGVLNLIKLSYFLKKRHHLNLKIVVHGSGPLFRVVKERIQDYGLNNIILKGFTPRTEFLKDLRRAKYVVIPSLYEACPMILLESMCLGKIPVLFDLPYALELTKKGEYGIIAKNIQDMAMKIKISDELDTECFRKRISDFAKKEYSVSNMASKYHDLYKSIID